MTAPASLGNPTVEMAIRHALEQAGSPYRTVEHAPVDDARHAAALRGTPLAIGGKSLLMKAGEDFILVATSSAGRIDSRRLRAHLGVRRLRFATRDELASLTGLVPGCVPPFGPPVLPFPLHADRGLLSNAQIAFTPGVRIRSFVMTSADWARVATPFFGDFVTVPG